MRKFYLVAFTVLGFILNSSAQSIMVDKTSLDFGNVCVGTTTTAKTFTISGSGLTGDVSIGAVTGFSYSKNSGGSYTSTLSFTASEISSSQDVFVKFSPTLAQSYNGTISISGGGVSSKTVAITATALSPTVNIGTTKTTICQGESVTFTATPSNAGETPTYQWQSNKGSGYGNIDGETGSTYTTSGIVAGEKIRVLMNVDPASIYCTTSATSNEITMQVNANVAPTVTIVSTTPVYTTSPQICPGTSITFSVNTKTNDGAPTYQWKVNNTPVSGKTSSTFTTNTLQDGDKVTLEMTSSALCAVPASVNSNEIVVVVKDATPVAPGNITGTVAQCPALTGQTYSIASVTTADVNGYVWTVPTGWTITAGQGSTSITVTTGAYNQNGSVSVTASNSCGTSSTKTLPVTVNPGTPVAPGNITGTVAQCPALTGQTYTIASVATADVNGYVWTVPTGWTITAGQGSTSITVTTGAYNQNGSVSVTASNSCGTSSTKTLPVTVNPGTPVAPGNITGTVAQCPALTGQTYSIASVATADVNGYVWTVPTGWTITAGQGSTSITVTTGAYNQNGSVSVTASNSCGTSSTKTLPVTVNPGTPVAPGNITGTVAQCPALTGQTYSIASVATADVNGYVWTVPTGWTITAGQGSTSITVTTGAYNQNGSVSVTASNSCGTSSTKTLPVTVNPGTPVAPGNITGTVAQCPALTGQTYSIASVATADVNGYVWTVPTGWTITAGQGSTSITVTTGAYNQNGSVSVTASNSCGTSSTKTLPVTVNPGTPVAPGNITGTVAQCPALTGQTYSIASVATADVNGYVWTVPTGWTITAGQGSTSITVTTGAYNQNGSVSVTASNSCGTSSTKTLPVTVNPGTPVTPGNITGAASVCNTKTGIYSVPSVSNVSYTWTVPAGWTINSEQGSNMINVTYGASDGNVSVTASNSCGTSSTQTLAVSTTTDKPDAPVSISGVTFICPTKLLTYSIDPVAGATGYTWSTPTSGWTISSGQGTTSLNVNVTSGSVSDQLKVTADNVCGSSDPASISVNVSGQYTVNAGPDQYVCYGTSQVQLAGSVTGLKDNGNSSNEWSWVNSTGIVSPYSLSSYFTIPAGSTGTLSVKIQLNKSKVACLGTKDEMLINILPTPIASINTISPVCSGSTSTVNFKATPNTILTYKIGTASPQTVNVDGSGNASITTSPLTSSTTCSLVSIAYSSSPNCSNTSINDVSSTIPVNPSVVTNAGSDQTVCSSSPNVTLAGSVSGGATTGTWSGGAGTFAPNRTTLNAVYTPTAAEIASGSVKLTLTGNDPDGVGPCGTTTDDVLITINPSVVTNAGSDQTVCSSSPNVTLAGSVSGGATTGTWSGGAGTFAPNRTTLNAVYTPTAAEIASGSVKLTLTGNDPDGVGPCGTTTDDVLITINPSVVTNAGSDQTVCSSSPNVTLAGSVSGGATTGTWSGGAGTFAPNRTTLNAVYTPTAAEIASGSVKLTLTGNDPDGVGPCGTTTDDVLITINPSVVTNAGSDQTVCSSSPNVTLAGSVSGGATTGTWSGGAGTFAPNRTTLNAVYTPTAAEIASGSVKLTLTGNDPDGVGPCGTTTDDVLITINPSVVTNAGSDQTVCSSSPNVTLAGSVSGGATTGTWSGGAGTFAPNRTTLNAVYTPTAAEIASGSVKLTLTGNDPDGVGPCGTTTDDVLITINPSVVTNAGSDQTVCSSSPNVTLAGSVSGGATTGTWSGGAGTFAPNRTTLNAVYTPTAAEIASGSVKLTLTGNDPDGVGPCGTTTDDVLITINPSVIISAGSNQTICSNSTATMAGSFNGSATSATWSTSGTGTFNDVNSTVAIYTPSAADIFNGSVTLTLKSNDPVGPCSFVSSSMTLTIIKAPVISTQASNVSVCENNQADFSISATGDDLSYQWYKGPIGAGTIVNNNSNISGAKTAHLHFASADLSAAGDYYVVVSGASPCNAATSEIRTMSVDQGISITTHPQTQTECEGSDITFNVVASANGADLSYQWFKNDNTHPIAGATNSTLVINNATTSDDGNYYVIITGTSGYMCSSATSTVASLTIKVVPSITTGPLNTPQSLCLGSNAAALSVVASGTGTLSYQWYSNSSNSNSGGTSLGNANGAQTNSYTPPTNTIETKYYYVVVTGDCGNATSNTAQVIINPLTTISANPTGANYCLNGTASALTVSASGTGTLSYQWYSNSSNSNSGGTSLGNANGAQTNSYTPPTNTVGTKYYYVVVTGDCENATSNTAQIIINPLTTISANPTGASYCLNGTANALTVTASGTGTLSYQWYSNSSNSNSGGTSLGNANGAQTNSYTPPTNTVGTKYYYVVVTGDCENATSNTAQIIINPLTTISANPTGASYCLNGIAAALTVSASGTGTLNYQWYSNNSNSNSGGTSLGNANGAQTNSYTPPTNTVGTKYYYVVVTGDCGNATSNTAQVIINPLTTISANPTGANYCLNGTASALTVSASGTGTLSYQWYSNSSNSNSGGTSLGNANGAQTNSYTPPTNTVGTKYYYVVVTGDCENATSNTAQIIINPLTTISANPTGASYCLNGTANALTVSASGTGTLSYQWYSNNSNSNSGGTSLGNANGAQTNSYTPLTTSDGTVYYYVEVRGTCGKATSDVSTVTVSPLPVGGTLSPSVTTGLCAGSNGGTVTLSGETGLVARWEQSVNGGVSWAPVNSLNTTTTATTLTYTNLTVSTLYRAVVQSGICAATAFSSNAVVAVTPPFYPTVTASPSTTICQGQPVTLITSSFSTLGSINQGDFSNANPDGWRVTNNGVEINFPASANNTDPNPWSETNGPKDFSGTTYGSQLGGKFAIVNGAKTSTLETPIFSSIGKTSDTLSFYQAFNLTSEAIARIEISTDGGNTYNATLAQYNPPSTFGVPLNGFVNVKIPLTSYLGMANLRVRFVYSSTGASSWAIDNLNTAATYQPVINSWKGSDGTSYTGDTLIASPTDTTTYTIITSTGGCTTTTTSVTVNVNKPPVITAQPSVTAAKCVGGSAGISVTVTGTALTYQWQVSNNGGTSWTNITGAPYTGFNTPVLSVANTTSAMAGNLYRVIATAPNPCNISDTSETAALKLTNVWTGTIDTDWNTGGNWSDGSVPGTSCPIVTIPVVITNNYPVLSTGAKATIISLQIDLNASAKITGNTMQLAGSITNNGIFDVTDGTVEFNGTTVAQNIAGSNFKNNIPGKNNTVKNLIISNNVNVANTAGDTLNITGLLSFSIDNTTLTTGNNLTLKSTKDNTASIGPLGADNSVSGQVEIERYINIGTASGTHPKSWQFLSTPTQGQSLINSWMEGIGGVTNTNSTGYGAQFNGTTGTSGYDGAPSIAPSVKSWDEGTGAWKEFANTGVQLYNPRGYFAFVRGDRSVDGKTVTTAKPTTLRSKGTIFIRDQSMDVPKQTADNVFFSIGNPYPSAVDMTKVLQKVDGIPDSPLQFYYVWSPVLNEGYGVGGWNTLFWNGTHYESVPGPIQNDMIQSGQAFLVQEDPATDTKVTFTEDAKVSLSNNLAFREQTQPGKVVQLATNLFTIQANGNTILADGTLQMFDKSFTGKLDRYDARKIMNTANNLAIKTSGVNLVVERRAPLTEQDTIQYNMSSMAKQNYRLEFKAQGLSSQGVEGFVEDTYLNTRAQMNMEGTTNVDFAVTSDKGSYAANRFRIVFKTAVVLPVKLVSVTAAQKDENIRVDWKVENEKAVKQYDVEKSVDGVSYKKAYTVAADNNGAGSYQWLDEQATPGNNFYRIRMEDESGKISYSDVVKVTIPFGKPSIGIYPNPITDGIIHLQMVNQPKGRYGLRLLNPLGQTIVAKQVEHAGGNATENIKWDYNLAHGVYELQVLKPGGKIEVIKVMY